MVIVLGNHLYIPKHSKHGRSIDWRKSYSLEERDLLKEIDEENDCRKHCVRITKALFNVRSRGSFHLFPSYFIKTVALDLEDNKEIDWTKKKSYRMCYFLFDKDSKAFRGKTFMPCV